MINAAQMRAARGLLNIAQPELARYSSVSLATVKRIELGATARADTIKAIRTALERRGVEFIAENGGGAGVRLRKRGRK
jgi:transcriptional regulator with XRE-family HTH domain